MNNLFDKMICHPGSAQRLATIRVSARSGSDTGPIRNSLGQCYLPRACSSVVIGGHAPEPEVGSPQSTLLPHGQHSETLAVSDAKGKGMSNGRQLL